LEKPLIHSPTLPLMTTPHPIIPSRQVPSILTHTHPVIGGDHPIGSWNNCLMVLNSLLHNSVNQLVAINPLPNNLYLLGWTYKVIIMLLLIPPSPN
jgi:hypothetical protein